MPGCCRHLSRHCCPSAAVRAKSVHQAVHCTASSDRAICSCGSTSRGTAVHRGRLRSHSSSSQSAAADWAAICSLRSWEWVSGCRRCMSAASSLTELSPTSDRWQWSRMPRASSPASFSRVPACSREARLQLQGGAPSITTPNTQQRGGVQQACLCSSEVLPAAAGHTAGRYDGNLQFEAELHVQLWGCRTMRWPTQQNAPASQEVQAGRRSLTEAEMDCFMKSVILRNLHAAYQAGEAWGLGQA